MQRKAEKQSNQNEMIEYHINLLLITSIYIRFKLNLFNSPVIYKQSHKKYANKYTHISICLIANICVY